MTDATKPVVPPAPAKPSPSSVEAEQKNFRSAADLFYPVKLGLRGKKPDA